MGVKQTDEFDRKRKKLDMNILNCDGCNAHIGHPNYHARIDLPNIILFLCEYCVEQEWNHYNAEWLKGGSIL